MTARTIAATNGSRHPALDPAPNGLLTGRRVLICLLAFFGVVFGVNGIMVKLALDTMPGTEVDSAYRASITFNAEAAAARLQAARSWQVTAHIARAADGASVRVEARDKSGTPVIGVAFSAWLERPADKRADRRIALSEQQAGLFRGEVSDVAAGQWDLVLEAGRGAERLFLSKTRVMLK